MFRVFSVKDVGHRQNVSRHPYHFCRGSVSMFQRIYSSLEIKKAIECYDHVKSFRKAAFLSGISKSTIHRWYSSFHRLLLRSHKIQIRKRYSKKPRNLKYPDIIQQLRSIFSSKTLSIFTLEEIQRRLEYPDNAKPSLSWIHASLRKARVSRRRFLHTCKVCPRSASDLKQLTLAFKSRLDTLKDDQIVCIDETGFCNIGNAMLGYFSKGKEPLATHVPKRERVSLLMAVHPSVGIVAETLQTKPYNTESFLAFLKDVLIPSLPLTTTAILMDNVAFHKSKRVSALLEQHGLFPLFIPPYSPRCNPIEEVFSIMKRYFRQSFRPENFLGSVKAAQEKMKLYKGVVRHYIHTRNYLENATS